MKYHMSQDGNIRPCVASSPETCRAQPPEGMEQYHGDSIGEVEEHLATKLSSSGKVSKSDSGEKIKFIAMYSELQNNSESEIATSFLRESIDNALEDNQSHKWNGFGAEFVAPNTIKIGGFIATPAAGGPVSQEADFKELRQKLESKFGKALGKKVKIDTSELSYDVDDTADYSDRFASKALMDRFVAEEEKAPLYDNSNASDSSHFTGIDKRADYKAEVVGWKDNKDGSKTLQVFVDGDDYDPNSENEVESINQIVLYSVSKKGFYGNNLKVEIEHSGGGVYYKDTKELNNDHKVFGEW